jgi:UDP-N-acetylmuramoyl-tripeptide--D-alanyl-D-alanine ligase
MQEIWQIKDILTALKITNKIKVTTPIHSLAIDSRVMKEGDVFLALKGPNFDAHNFLLEVEKKGASVLIVENINPKITIPQILVSNTLQALYDLALYKRQQTKAKIIAITGSVGKTSAKEMLYKFCSFYGKSYASLGNFNNNIGLPLSLANLPADCKFAVFELGMNHVGEIEFLSNMLRPNIAWITLVSNAHIGNFNDIEDIIEAKSEIFSGLVPTGKIILNHNDKNFLSLKEKALKNHGFSVGQIKTYGSKLNNDLIIKNISYQDQIIIEVMFNNKSYELKFSLSNIALIKVIIAIIIILDELGLDYESSLSLFAKLKAVSGRGNIIEYKERIFINDSYNASPVSMQAALENLAYLGKIKQKRTIAIIGTMLELGNKSKELHLSLGRYLHQYNIDRVITIGEYMKDLFKTLPQKQRLAHFSAVKGNKENIRKLLKKSDIILLKSSRGLKLEDLLA